MVSWEFFLEPFGNGQTRLLVRGRVSASWPGTNNGHKPSVRRPIERVYQLLSHTPRWLMTPVAEIGHGIMQARQLQQIRRRAEGGCQAHR